MIAATDPDVQALLTAWHEAGRAAFEADGFKSLDYDSPAYAKTAAQRRKYICLDVGSSGAFMLDRASGMIYNIKGYGVPHKRLPVGTLGEVTGAMLDGSRWRRLR